MLRAWDDPKLNAGCSRPHCPVRDQRAPSLVEIRPYLSEWYGAARPSEALAGAAQSPHTRHGGSPESHS
jgi:hypothetical protein